MTAVSDNKTASAAPETGSGADLSAPGSTSPQSRSGTASERRCIATRQSLPKADLIRFVVGPDDQLVPDLAEKLPGRGIWVKADRAALGLAVSKGLFARAARSKVLVPDDLEERVEALLLQRLTNHIHLARKAGAALSGFEKVEAQLAKDKVVILFEASDGARDGREKLLRILKNRQKGQKPPAKLVEFLNSMELSLAFDRQRVIHAALTAAPVATLVLADVERLAGFRTQSPEVSSGDTSPGSSET